MSTRRRIRRRKIRMKIRRRKIRRRRRRIRRRRIRRRIRERRGLHFIHNTAALRAAINGHGSKRDRTRLVSPLQLSVAVPQA